MRSLGQTIKDKRELISLTLRQMEEATGISNAYLSQLENDKIKKPSANVLYKIATILNIELDTLLAASGIIDEMSAKPSRMLNTISFKAQNITSQEEEELLKYLKFLRSQKE